MKAVPGTHHKNTNLETYLYNSLTVYRNKEIYMHTVLHESVQSTHLKKLEHFCIPLRFDSTEVLLYSILDLYLKRNY